MDRTLTMVHPDYPGYIFQLSLKDDPAGIIVTDTVLQLDPDPSNEPPTYDTQYLGEP